jgi:hypothetical protein
VANAGVVYARRFNSKKREAGNVKNRWWMSLRQGSVFSPGEPVLTAVCHCKNCQKQTGTSFSVIISVPSLALSVKGTLKTFDDTCDGEKPVHRNFCPDCGSPVTSIIEARPGLSFIKAGTLDDASWLKPTVEIWCGSAQPWVSLVGDRQKFAKAPG